MKQVQDPVCGMTIDASQAAGTSMWNGERYYFCSTACQHQFDDNPSEFVSDRRNSDGREPPFTKTGPIVAPKFGAAGSGGAEYEPGPDPRRR
ncbi:MAG TPA: YHS domain-containing protein [Gemmatimonadales bacterium]|jgi:YHS domain-containing protein